ncbi:MAG: O-antigen translocase [Bacteroidetes bacterium]|nr:MAG: O-antigen translocase [Bacteroidota bacterium]
MIKNQSSYRQILKATSLLSGVQVFSILISIAKSKFAAIFIGPAGIGIIGLLNSTLNLIIGFTKLGLDVSAVKEISVANEETQPDKVVRVINVLSRLTWITGIFGAVITIILSSWLSKVAFGNTAYTFSFIFISIAVFFNQLTVGNLAVLQGLRKLNDLAKATLWASFCSLLVIIPIYYYYGVKGIVPVIILTSIFTFIFSWYFTKKYKTKSKKIIILKLFGEGKQMMKLGFVLSLGSLATLVTAYIVQVFITNRGGINEVGFYNAAFIIINAYVGVIFNAMSKDYFPRLASIANQSNKLKSVVNQQAFVAILLLTPIIIVFLAFAPLLVNLLFTKAFSPIIGMLTFGILATLFKAVSWSLGYILVAKGDSKLFIQTEIGFNMLLLSMSILGYIYGGLTGVGISYLLYYIIYLLGIKTITKRNYNFQFSLEFYKIFIACIVFCLSTFLLTFVENNYIKYGLMIIMIVSSCTFTIVKLNEKTDLISVLKKRLNKNNDKI